MLERYPDIMGHFGIEVEQNVINQIRTAIILGNAAALFVEVKTLELFALLFCNEDSCQSGGLSSSIRDKMFEARYIIEKQYRTPPTIDELAKHLGLCTTLMKRYFKKVFNRTIYGYLLDYRMLKAEQYLKDKLELNINEIAENVGYDYASHFTTAFKRKYELTPLEYRLQSIQKTKGLLKGIK